MPWQAVSRWAWPGSRVPWLRAVKAWETTQENPAGCSGLDLAKTAAFAFCLQLRGQLVPAGCRQEEKVPAVAPGRETPCFCHFASLMIQGPCPWRGEEVGLHQASVGAQQPLGLPRDTGVLWPPRCLLSHCPHSICLSVSSSSTWCSVQQLSASSVRAGGLLRGFILWLQPDLLPCVAVVHM